MNCAVRNSYFMHKQLTIKEVEICLVSPSVSYSFGKTGAPNKEMELIVPTDKTSYASQNNRLFACRNLLSETATLPIKCQPERTMKGITSPLWMFIREQNKPVSIWQR